jgi:hypothetical protein
VDLAYQNVPLQTFSAASIGLSYTHRKAPEDQQVTRQATMSFDTSPSGDEGIITNYIPVRFRDYDIND